jgi:hypothetical protein
MIERIAGNRVRTIICEMANRFAKDPIVQEARFRRLKDEMITLSAARALRGRPRGPSGAPGAGSRIEGRELCAHDATTTVISFESLMSLL